jgi:hypothetical protein
MLSILMFHIHKAHCTTQNLRIEALPIKLFKNCPRLLLISNTAPQQYYSKKFSNAVRFHEDKINKQNQQGKQYYKMLYAQSIPF